MPRTNEQINEHALVMTSIPLEDLMILMKTCYPVIKRNCAQILLLLERAMTQNILYRFVTFFATMIAAIFLKYLLSIFLD